MHISRRSLVVAAGMWPLARNATAEAAFATVTPRPLVFPRDHGAHPEYRTEWWYLTGWLDAPGHPSLGFQVTFFPSAHVRRRECEPLFTAAARHCPCCDRRSGAWRAAARRTPAANRFRTRRVVDRRHRCPAGPLAPAARGGQRQIPRHHPGTHVRPLVQRAAHPAAPAAGGRRLLAEGTKAGAGQPLLHAAATCSAGDAAP